jgi:hypothetical protein
MAQTLVRLLVHLIFSTKDRANVIRPDVEGELIQFLHKHGVDTTSATSSGGEGVCDPFRVVMWFVGGGRFPGGVAPGYVTNALSGRVPQHIQDLPRPMQHLLRTRHSRVQQIRAPERPCQKF